MRILSQDGKSDFPYEKVCLEVSDSGKIFAQGGIWGAEDNYIEVAKYENEAKARKAMEMLRNAYSSNIKIKEPIQKEMPKLRSGDWVWTVSEPRVEVLDNFYFLFPADDEVKV